MSGSTLSLTMRPKTFEEVIGLEKQVAALLKKLDSGDVPRGFLLTGPYGCGKTTIAWLIARAVQGWDFDGDPQVIEVNGANARKIEDMRAMADRADALPMMGKYSVVILDEVHQLTKEAQQILLKELEVKNGPTVWILATTDPQKLNEGVRDRCVPVVVNGMSAKERAALVARAAKATDHAGDPADFLVAVTKANMTSPRKILQAFELYHNGLAAEQAVASMTFNATPEYYAVARAVVFGKTWFEASTLIQAVEASLTKKAKEAEETEVKSEPEKPEEKKDDTQTVDDSEVAAVMGKPEAARTFRAIAAAMLKNIILKGDARAPRAADALHSLAHCTPPSMADTGLEFAATVGGLYRVHVKMAK